MSVEGYRRLRAVFVEASRREGEDRARYLDEACAGDAGLRAEVERLLLSPTIATGEIVAPSDEPAPESCGPYRIEGELGRGGMGVVYAARAPGTGEAVALKLMLPHHAASPDLLERFVREAALGRQVDHPNVVRSLDAGHADGRPYLVMERVRGRTLRDLLRGLGTVPARLLR